MSLSGRLVLRLSGLPAVGPALITGLRIGGLRSIEETQLRHRPENDVLPAPGAPLPCGRIGKLEVSRLILGGNLVGGWAHAGGLVYVSRPVRAYYTRARAFQTFELAETCGINTLLANSLLCEMIGEYWRTGGRIQFISDCGGKDLLAAVRRSIDSGACACYVMGGVADGLAAAGQFDLLAKALDVIRASGLPAGLGAHRLVTVRACVERGLRPDFWMKTFAATPTHWCPDPHETAAFMRGLPEPWIAFKVLGAGALEPAPAFQNAFESGAAFVCAGMYDFQVAENARAAAGAFTCP
jgi:hypothetical protein